ncbi:MAG: hypothetical protein ACI9F9_002356 [Candidatus Paceibacteria bacterium]|jgi:hypothetical protein
MNRSIAIFVALAVLIAHSLAIRTTILGDLAPPYDQAYVGYRVARNLVFEGQWSWSPGVDGFDSYGSALWILICAFAERLSLPINTFVRIVGVLATASSLVFATRFHPNRAASLITPMLLAISGAMAAGAVSGTETALMTALVTGSFLAYEHRHDRSLALFLALCGWTHDEGWVLALVLFGLRLLDRRREPDSDKKSSLLPFIFPCAAFMALTGLRFTLTGHLTSPWMLDLVHLREGEIANGIAYVRDFFVSSVSPCLILYCLWYFMRRFLSDTGTRALLVILVWTSLVILQGGGTTPFSESMVPILPLILIAGQEGLITALNSAKSPVRTLAWTSFLVAVLASALASRRPSDMGPIPLKAMQEHWMHATAAPRLGFQGDLGRQGLDEEARATHALREIGIFMRDQVNPPSSVLTLWPGSLAYLSGLAVKDLTGRVTPAAPHTRTVQDPLPSDVDVVAALREEPDYIVPDWVAENGHQDSASLASYWHQLIDVEKDRPARVNEIEAALSGYEWITIPLANGTKPPRARILRKRSLGLAPKLSAHLDGKQVVIELEHPGHVQLADLIVFGIDSLGQSCFLSPTGAIRVGERSVARANLLVIETGERTVELMRWDVPSVELNGMSELTIMLLNPGTREDNRSSWVAGPLSLSLPR